MVQLGAQGHQRVLGLLQPSPFTHYHCCSGLQDHVLTATHAMPPDNNPFLDCQGSRGPSNCIVMQFCPYGTLRSHISTTPFDFYQVPTYTPDCTHGHISVLVITICSLSRREGSTVWLGVVPIAQISSSAWHVCPKYRKRLPKFLLLCHSCSFKVPDSGTVHTGGCCYHRNCVLLLSTESCTLFLFGLLAADMDCLLRVSCVDPGSTAGHPYWHCYAQMHRPLDQMSPLMMVYAIPAHHSSVACHKQSVTISQH